jgi:hypothetical protein
MITVSQEDLRRLRDVASAYKRVILLVALEWVCGGFANSQTARAGGGGPLPILLGLAAFAAACGLVVFGYRLAKALELPVPVLWAIGVVIPVLNLIVLLILSRTAQAACRKHGVKVGLVGPDEADLLRLERAAEAAQAAQAAQAAYAAQAGAPPPASR